MTKTPVPSRGPKPVSAPPAGAIDAAARYRVTLSKPIKLGVTNFNAGSRLMLTGAVLKTILANVESYTRA